MLVINRVVFQAVDQVAQIRELGNHQAALIQHVGTTSEEIQSVVNMRKHIISNDGFRRSAG